MNSKLFKYSRSIDLDGSYRQTPGYRQRLQQILVSYFVTVPLPAVNSPLVNAFLKAPCMGLKRCACIGITSDDAPWRSVCTPRHFHFDHQTIELCSHLRLAIPCGIHESIASRLLPALRRQPRIIKYDNTTTDITSCSGRSLFISALIPDLYVIALIPFF